MTPSEYKRKVLGLKYSNAKEKTGAKGWAYPTIDVILRNRVYTGAMVQHKSEKISYKVEKIHYIPKEQQYVVEGMHEAIISKETFEQVQENIDGLKNLMTQKGFIYEDISNMMEQAAPLLDKMKQINETER